MILNLVGCDQAFVWSVYTFVLLVYVFICNGKVKYHLHFTHRNNDFFKQKLILLSILANCSHSRVWMYYAEAVKNENSFQAIAAKSYDCWRKTRYTNDSQIIYVAENMNRQYVSKCTATYRVGTSIVRLINSVIDGRIEDNVNITVFCNYLV